MSSNKRGASSDNDGGQPPSKKTLHGFFNISAVPAPDQIGVSPPFTDRRSTFVAHAAAATTAVGATQFQNYVRALRNKNHPREADHEMMAFRTMSLKPGKTGLKEDDWTVKVGSDDDSEKGGGSTIRRLLEDEIAVDVVVVCSRWYGGTMLGQDRFRHIQLVCQQALAQLTRLQQLPALCTRLAELDAEILEHTVQPGKPVKASQLTTPKTYENDASMDLAKAERLIKAREKRLAFLEKKRAEEDEKAIEEQRVVAEEEDAINELLSEGSGGGTPAGIDDVDEDEDWEREAAEAFAQAEAAEAKRAGS